MSLSVDGFGAERWPPLLGARGNGYSRVEIVDEDEAASPIAQPAPAVKVDMPPVDQQARKVLAYIFKRDVHALSVIRNLRMSDADLYKSLAHRLGSIDTDDIRYRGRIDEIEEVFDRYSRLGEPKNILGRGLRAWGSICRGPFSYEPSAHEIIDTMHRCGFDLYEVLHAALRNAQCRGYEDTLQRAYLLIEKIVNTGKVDLNGPARHGGTLLQYWQENKRAYGVQTMIDLVDKITGLLTPPPAEAPQS